MSKERSGGGRSQDQFKLIPRYDEEAFIPDKYSSLNELSVEGEALDQQSEQSSQPAAQTVPLVVAISNIKARLKLNNAWSCFLGILIGVSAIVLVYFLSEILYKFFPKGVQLTPHGAVASDVEECSKIGLLILKQGGSSVDSSIATLLCLGVINAFSSGIGGGGFMLIRQGSTTEVIDFREVAPSASTYDMFSRGNHSTSSMGAKSIAIPGELKGMEVAHNKYGKLAWAVLFQPAIQLATEGFRVTSTLAKTLQMCQADILSNREFAAIYAPNGILVEEGDLIKRLSYGKTLQLIAEEGASVFYNGPLAETLVKEIQEKGGIIQFEDFSKYQALIRKPVMTSWNQYNIFSAPAPASGPVLIEILNILEGFNFTRSQEELPSTYHKIVEAFKFAYAHRTRIADPAFANIQSIVDPMLSKTEAARIRMRINSTKTFEPDYYGPHYDMEPTPGTTHLSVWTNSGEESAVSVTSTINFYFGSFLMSPSSGVIWNDEMDDFSSPNITNGFGVAPSAANFIEPGKRPLSSSSPVIITEPSASGKGEKIKMVVGSSGGTRITTSTAWVILKCLLFSRGIDEAIQSPRFHHQLLPNTIFVEEGISLEITQILESFGHNITHNMPRSNVQGILFDTDGRFNASSDHRKDGIAKLF